MSDTDDEARRRELEWAQTYSDRYRDPSGTAGKQLTLIAHWGAEIPPPARILEVGCADGFVTSELVRAGYEVTAWDHSQPMIDTAAKRLAAAGLVADLAVVDIRAELPAGDFDVVACFMRNFFMALDGAEPSGVVNRLGERARRKLFIDCNPRTTPIGEAQRYVREAGFDRVAWRPMITPQRVRLPAWARSSAELIEVTPGLRRAVASVRFNAVIKGEREAAAPTR